jgi:dTDP-glucose 4,6-dehydratase
MYKFVVTGGRGFIGSHFVEKCLNDGHKVIDIDCMTYAANESLPWDDHPNYQHINENIKDITHLPMCDTIVNFAAESHVDNSIQTPDVFVDSNVLGVLNILNLLRGKVYECPLLVHISTDEVYGDVLTGEKTEESILEPSNPYSASKAAAEMLVHAYGRTYGIDYQIVRSTNNYGPRQYPEKLIPKIIECITEGRKIPLHGDGSYVRDWIYVKDNADGIYKVCFAEKKNEIWNMCSYNYLKNIEVVEHLCDWMGVSDPSSAIKYVENRIGQDARYSISSEKSRNELGWKPEHSTLYNFLGD